MYINSPLTPEGILDAARLTTGEIADALQTRLRWAVGPADFKGGQPDLRPYLERLWEFCPDFCWAIPDPHGPTQRLVRAMDELLRLEASGAGWGSGRAKELLAVAIEELRAWPRDKS